MDDALVQNAKKGGERYGGFDCGKCTVCEKHLLSFPGRERGGNFVVKFGGDGDIEKLVYLSALHGSQNLEVKATKRN